MEQDVTIGVAGGPGLEARLGVVEHASGGLVVCHPHPLYGGDMENPVVVRATEVARETGLSTLRFNFRGVGRSTGVHGGGEAEQQDVSAALELLQSELPADRPMGLGGYSFGAWVAARVTATNTRVAALCLIAPPVAMLEFGTLEGNRREILLVAGTRDAYCPIPSLEALASRTPGARVITIEGADHFFFGKLYPLGEAIRAWAKRWAAE
jgi:alpha/beta superfamily hydrolase